MKRFFVLAVIAIAVAGLFWFGGSALVRMLKAMHGQ